MVIVVSILPLSLFLFSFVFAPLIATEILRVVFHGAETIPFKWKFFVKYEILIASMVIWLVGLIVFSANGEMLLAKLGQLPLFRMGRVYEYSVIAIVVGLMYCCSIFRTWYLRKRLGD